MMAFQHEPDHQDQPNRCDRCHNVFFVASMKSTSEGDPYCSHCGFVFGTSVAPASWVCEDCAEVVLDHGGEDRPWCETCELPMSCVRATASLVHGAGTSEELDIGLALLLQAQVVVGDPKENYRVLAQLGLAEDAETRRKEQKRGEDAQGAFNLHITPILKKHKDDLKLGLDILKDMTTGN